VTLSACQSCAGFRNTCSLRLRALPRRVRAPKCAPTFSIPSNGSAVMRAVKSRDTAPELKVRTAVRDLGYARRYRLNNTALPGKPDLVFGPMRKVIFVHGCF